MTPEGVNWNQLLIETREDVARILEKLKELPCKANSARLDGVEKKINVWSGAAAMVGLVLGYAAEWIIGKFKGAA